MIKTLLTLLMIALLGFGCGKTDESPPDTAPRLARVIMIERPMAHMDNDIREYSVIETLDDRRRYICAMVIGEVGDEFMVDPVQCYKLRGAMSNMKNWPD